MSGLCGPISGVASTVGSLGFKGAGCCRLPCPAFPLHHVVICFEVNATSSVQIDVGCPGVGATGCATQWIYGAPQDSWGRQTRVVQFDQQVQDGAFIRITTCAKSPSCTVSSDCGLGPEDPLVEGSFPLANKLLRYIVDGTDITRYLQTVLSSESHTDGCVYVGCSDHTPANTDCCNYAGTNPFADLAAVPYGSEITVGPIGGRAWALI